MESADPEGSHQEGQWSVEEAEVAARDRNIWKYLSRQAAGAVNVRC